MSNSIKKIPIADLHRQYLAIKDEIDDAIATVIRSSSFIRGPFVEEFEQKFAQANASPHCVSVANGTDSLYIAMKCLGVRPGDEVIVPAMSWISTSETVTQAGASVIFSDIDPHTRTISVSGIERAITSKTVGIIPVHLYGHPANIEEICSIARAKGIWVLEDCAQSHFATVRGRSVGTFGTAASFSFYPGKNLGAMGDAGAILTSNADLADKMAMFARHGGRRKGEHVIEGINSRLDGLQAAILTAKLRHISAWTGRRVELAHYYISKLQGIPGLTLPTISPGTNHVFHLFVIQHVKRDELSIHLRARGIETAVNYPIALPFLPCYDRFGAKPPDFPVAHELQNTCLTLPLFPEMSLEEANRVCSEVKAFCLEGAGASRMQ